MWLHTLDVHVLMALVGMRPWMGMLVGSTKTAEWWLTDGSQAVQICLQGHVKGPEFISLLPHTLSWTLYILEGSWKHLSPLRQGGSFQKNKVAENQTEYNWPCFPSPSNSFSLLKMEHSGTFVAIELNSSSEKRTRKGPKSFIVSAVQFWGSLRRDNKQ